MTPGQQVLKEWRTNVPKFVWDNFKATPDPWQLDFLKVFPSRDPDKLRISLQACVGPGKTAVLSWAGLNFLSCYGERGEHPKGAAVAVSRDNLKANLWPELAKWQQRSEFLKQAFTWTATRLYSNDHPETWFLDARSWPKSADPERLGKTLSGLHSKFVLCLIDESGEIPIEIMKSADQTLSSCWFGKIVQAGNPSSTSGMLYAAATKLRSQWYVIRITGDPDDPKAWQKSPRVDPANLQWAKDQIALWGRDNPWVMYSILGQFPPGSINSLLGYEEVEAAMGRHLKPEDYNWAQKRLGIDAAWHGDDKWVIYPRQGLASFKPEAMRNPKTEEIGSRVIMAKQNFGSEREYFDNTGGFAAGASDFFQAAGYTPMRVDFSGKPIDPRFYNKRAEMWWNLAQWVKGGGALTTQIPEIVEELTETTYSYKNGKLLLEPKDLLKKRIGRSPDWADALALTFAEPEMPRNIATLLGSRKKAGSEDFDPYRNMNDELPKQDFDPYRVEI